MTSIFQIYFFYFQAIETVRATLTNEHDFHTHA